MGVQIHGDANLGMTQGMAHDLWRKEIEATLRPQMERETRGDMQSEPSHEVVNKEIAYRWSQEVAAMGKLSQEKLEMVYKIGFKPTDYLAHK